MTLSLDALWAVLFLAAFIGVGVGYFLANTRRPR